jgi:hypothetical protein
VGANLPIRCFLRSQLNFCSRCLAAALRCTSSPLLPSLLLPLARAAAVVQPAPLLLLLVNLGAA